MKKTLVGLLLFLISVPSFGGKKEESRLEESATVLKEILDIPDGMPKDYLDKSDCLVIFPSVKKFAIGLGASYGRGVITCRTGKDFNGPWSSPAMFALEGASAGFQLGGQATDFVLLVMNEKGANSVLTSKVKVGADASAAAGPKGRDAAAATDIVAKAEILSYSRSRGLFGGISLEGSTLRSDDGANKSLYGSQMSAKDIVREGKVTPPAAAQSLLALLNAKSPSHPAPPKPKTEAKPAATKPSTAAKARPKTTTGTKPKSAVQPPK